MSQVAAVLRTWSRAPILLSLLLQDMFVSMFLDYAARRFRVYEDLRVDHTVLPRSATPCKPFPYQPRQFFFRAIISTVRSSISRNAVFVYSFNEPFEPRSGVRFGAVRLLSYA